MESEATLPFCLDSINKTLPVHHLIVIDGGSGDRSVAIAREFGSLVIQRPGSISANRYLGAKVADTELVCFVDSDTVLLSGWYERLRKWFTTKGVVWVQGLARNGSSYVEQYARAKNALLRSKGFVTFGHTLIYRDQILSLAPDWAEDPRNSGEDVMLLNRVIASGRVVVTDPTFTQAVHLPDSFLHDVYGAYRGALSNMSGGVLAALPMLLFYVFTGVRQFARVPRPTVLTSNLLMGLAYLAGLLFSHSLSLKSYMKRLELRSKMIGAKEARVGFWEQSEGPGNQATAMKQEQRTISLSRSKGK